jgi:hypothetical protein
VIPDQKSSRRRSRKSSDRPLYRVKEDTTMITIAISPSVALPRVDSGVLVALVHSLATSFHAAQAAHHEAAPSGRRKTPSTEAAAPSVVISECVSECMTRLRAANTRLEEVRRAADPGVPRGPSRVQRRSLVGRYRRAWNVLRRQLLVWRDNGAIAKLAPSTRDAFERVFGKAWGSPDLRGGAMTLWIAGNDALDKMKTEGVIPVITEMGGASVLAAVRASHDELGAAFGVTQEIPANDTAAGLSDAVADVQTVLREYVIKVHAMQTPSVAASTPFVARLLAPFEAVIESSRAVAKSAKAKAEKVKAEKAEKDKKATPVAPVAPVVTRTGTDG